MGACAEPSLGGPRDPCGPSGIWLTWFAYAMGRTGDELNPRRLLKSYLYALQQRLP
jgi:hypothetical protein